MIYMTEGINTVKNEIIIIENISFFIYLMIWIVTQ